MLLQKLSLKDFKQYKDISIDFKEGLIGIIGKNGSGKSSIFEAIILALFGETPLGKSYLRRHSANEKETVKIELTVEINKKLYKVIREYRGKNLTAYAELYLDQKLICSTHREVSNEICKIIGMNKDSFCRSIFAAQKELGLLSELKGAERREFIREILGVNKIDLVQQAVREEGNSLKNEINAQRQLLLTQEEMAQKEKELQALKIKLNNFEKNINELKEKLLTKEKLVDQAKQALEKIQNRFKEHARLNEALTSLNKEEEVLLENQVKLKNEIQSLKTELLELESLAKEEDLYKNTLNRLSELEKTNELFLSIKNLKDQLSEQKNKNLDLNQKIAELCSDLKIECQIEKLNETVNKLENELKNEYDLIQHKLNYVNEKLQSLSDRINELKTNLELLQKKGSEADCPVCLRKLGESFTTTLERIQDLLHNLENEKASEEQNKINYSKSKATIEEKQANFKKQAQKIKICFEMLGETEKEISNINNKITTLGPIDFNEKEYQSLKTSLKELTLKHERYLALLQKKSLLSEIEKQLSITTQRLNELSQRINEKNTELNQLAFKEIELEKANQNLQECQLAYNNSWKSFSEQQANFISLQHQVNTLAEQLKTAHERQAKLAEREERHCLLVKLDTLLNDFKSSILDKIKPLISRTASNLFADLTQGRYEAINIDDNFNFLIFDEGDYFPLDRFSGGEKDLANLCLRLALSEAIRELEGAASPSFLAFDEIFGSQDQERRTEIFNSLLKLKEKYRQILVITHDEDLKDQFPQILEVRRSTTGSQVVWL